MYNAETVAGYVIQYYNDNGSIINNLKLQKILYFLQANHLVGTNTPLFEDEIEAVDFGPSILSVWNKYRKYGGASIYSKADKTNYYLLVKKEDQLMINEMLKEFTDYSSNQLLEIIHNQTPWRKAYYGPATYEPYKEIKYGFIKYGFRRKKIITNKSLYDFFKE